MAEYTFTKKFDLSQFAHKHPGVPLRAVGPEEDGSFTIKTDEWTQEELETNVKAYRHSDTWEPPEPSPDPEIQRIEELKAKETWDESDKEEVLRALLEKL